MKTIISIVLIPFLVIVLFTIAVVRTQASIPMEEIIFTVNSDSDLPDAVPGDGVCEASTGEDDCTLRAATMEANSNSNPDITIILPAGVYRITIPAINPEDEAHGSLKIYRSLIILGAGSSQTTIDGNGLYTNDRAVEVLSSINNSSITFQGLTIQDGNATTMLTTGAMGGGIYASLGNEAGASGSLTLQDVLFKRNSAQGEGAGGGGLYLEGWSQSSFTLLNVIVSDNSVESDSYVGAGLQLESGDYDQGSPYSSLVIQDSSIKNNRAIPLTSGNPWGGGIDVRHGLLTVIRSTMANNLADNGGAISVAGAFSRCDLINSTLSGNQANLNGGGIYAVDGITSLSSTTIMGNNSDYDLNGSGLAGGIYQTGSATVTLANSLLIFNHETYYSGEQHIYVPRHGDLRGIYTTEGYNGFTQTMDSVFNGPHELDQYDFTLAFIGSLAFNGGATLTRALYYGSEAINAGNPAGCNDPEGNPLTTDQRGFQRVIDGRCDMGAYEHNPIIYLPMIHK
jgi:predicted outer membrane repeat protein